MSAPVFVVTGTSTDVGKTVAVAALTAALTARGVRAGVCKPVQTGVARGEPGDLAEVIRLAGDVPVTECARFPAPLAPETAAARAGLRAPDRAGLVARIDEARGDVEALIVEGAGGVMVRLGPDLTLLDVAAGLRDLGVPPAVVVVAAPGLGTLNHTELTVRAVQRAGLRVSGLILGSWPADPDLAAVCNRADLPRLTGVPIVGILPAGAGALAPEEFRAAAPRWLDADWLGRELAPRTPHSSGHPRP